MRCPYFVSFARCATDCSAFAHIAQRTRFNVTTATRATRSRPLSCFFCNPLSLALKLLYIGRHTTIPWNDFHLFWYEISLYRRATSIKILTYSYFLVSYSSLKQTYRRVPLLHTHTHTRAFIIYMYKPIYTYMRTANYCH
jgi:hypothetical protein